MQWRMRLASFLLFAMLLTMLSGCAGRRKWVDQPADVAWEKIQNYYGRKKYLDAVEHLEIFLINHAGTAKADSAQFILAESHFKMKEYIIAAAEYEKLVSQYPQSPLVEEASYKMGLSFYKLSPKYSLDQSYTHRAFDSFQLFLEEFPASEYKSDALDMIDEIRDKLAKKVFENGRLYQKVKEYDAARIYYDEVLNNYYDTEYAPKALFEKGMTYEAVADTQGAIDQYATFLSKYSEDALEPRARNGLNRMLGHAQKISHSFRVELYGSVGFNTYKMNDVNDRLEAWDDEEKEMETISFGTNYQAGLRMVMPHLGALGLYSYRMGGNADYKDSDGKLSFQIPVNVIEIAPSYHVIRGEDIDLYAGIGIGWYMPDVSLLSHFSGYDNNYYTTYDEAKLGFRPFVEVQTFVWDRVSVILGLGYRINESDDIPLGATGEKMRLDWSGLSASAGVGIVLFSK